jgi:hypothetical protein
VDRSDLDSRTLLLALLCLVVVGLGAATLTETTNPTEPGMGSLGGSGDGQAQQGATQTPEDPGGSDGNSIIPIGDEQGPPFTVCVSWLTDPLVQFGLVGGLVAFFVVVTLVRDLPEGLAFSSLLGYVGLLVYLFLTSCQTATGDFLSGAAGQRGETGSGLAGGGAVSSPPLSVQLVFLAVVGIFVVAAVVVLTSDHDLTSRTVETAEEDESDESGEPDLVALGEAAGAAADRIEYEDEFENEVYRAWAEMTAFLTVEHPESSTPGEFAAAAVDAGMDLFTAVRYGDEPVTEDRERAAVETLRRIESVYAGDGS